MSCRHVAKDQPRVLPGRHGDQCPEDVWHPPLAWVDCAGCQPCPQAHCAMPWCSTHVGAEMLTCPECVGSARDDIDGIGAMTMRLLTEAVHRGINSEAAMLDGPAADPDVFGRRLALAIDNRLCECQPAPHPDDFEHPMECPYAKAYIDDARDEAHPLYVLGTWDMVVTEHYGHERTQRVTIASAAAYLTANLTELAQDPEFSFDQLAGEVRRCRSHMEDVLAEGEWIVRGAPCVQCGTRMVRVISDQGAQDAYHCTSCKRTDKGDQYRYAVSVAYVASADELPARELAERIGRPLGTIKRWAGKQRGDLLDDGTVEELPPLLPACGRHEDGRRLYRVEDAERLARRDTTALATDTESVAVQ